MPVRRYIPAFRLRDLQEIAAHAGEADRLRRRRAFIRGRHLLQISAVDDKK